MAFSQEENKVIQQGIENGATTEEISQALTNFRLGRTPGAVINEQPSGGSGFFGNMLEKARGFARTDVPEASKNFINELVPKIEARAERVGDIQESDRGTATKGYQIFGQGLGAVADVTEGALSKIPGFDEAFGAIGAGIKKLSETAPVKALGDYIGNKDFVVEAVTLYQNDPDFRDTVDATANITRATGDVAFAMDVANFGEKVVRKALDKINGLAPGASQTQVIDKAVRPTVEKHILTRQSAIDAMIKSGDMPPLDAATAKSAALGVKTDIVKGLTYEGQSTFASLIDDIPNSAFNNIDDLAKAIDEVLNSAAPNASGVGVLSTSKLASRGEEAFSSVVEGTTKLADDAIKGVRGAASETVQKSINSSVDDLLNSTRGINNRRNQLLAQNVDVADMLKDQEIYRGIKVENKRIVPDQAIDTLQGRIDVAMDAKAKILPLADKYGTSVKKAAVYQEAVDWIKSQKLAPAEEKKVIAAIEKQLQDVPNEMLPSTADEFRARFRKSSTDAKGILKRDSEYAALENAFRELVFETTDDLPFGDAGTFGELNTYIKQQISAIDFLDQTLRGQTVKGGRLGGYTSRVVGAIAGSGGGLFGSLVGAEVGGVISDIIANNQLGGSIKLALIKEITNNPEVIRLAEKLIREGEGFAPRQIAAPVNEQINLPASSADLGKFEDLR